MHKFSNVSKKRLKTCHKDLRLIMKESLKVSDIDFGIAEGFRTIEKQNEYFKKGLSKIDGINRLSKHNQYPSLAVDIYPFIEGSAKWDKESLSYIAGVIHTVTHYLLLRGLISHKVRWGGNWDSDGVILLDQSFDDRPHFELVKAAGLFAETISFGERVVNVPIPKTTAFADEITNAKSIKLKNVKVKVKKQTLKK